MLNKAVARYHELLQDVDLAESSRRVLADGLDQAKLIFGGRPLSPYLRPHFVTESDWARVTVICESIWSALQKVKDAAVRDDALLTELGLTDIERELVAIDPGYAQVSASARLDSFLTSEAYSFVELNGESPAGIAYSDAAVEIFSSLPVMKKFAEEYNLRPQLGSQLLLDCLLQAHEEYLGHPPEQAPTIAIVDLKDLPTLKEFELFRDFFVRQGYPAIICSPDELVWDGTRLRVGDVVIDIVYKRLLVNEYIPIIEQYPALVDAYRAGAICMANSFRSKLVHKKAIFAVLTNPTYAHLFSDEELKNIAAHVPWTRKVRDEQTIHGVDPIDLLEFIKNTRNRLVLKPNDDYGGHGIYIGWNSTEEEWAAALEHALENGDYLVQERVPTAREEFPALMDDGTFQFSEQLVDLDPLLFNGKVGTAFTRLSSSELANVSSGGGMVPTFIISEK
ncbi:MAG: hypothetical protein ABIP75_19180 [Pyrinomonadaceae bacterium]